MYLHGCTQKEAHGMRISCWCCSKLMSATCTDTWHKLHHAQAINEGVALPGQNIWLISSLEGGVRQRLTMQCMNMTLAGKKKSVPGTCSETWIRDTMQALWRYNKKVCYQRRCGHVECKANCLSNNVGHLKGTVSKHYHKQLE